MKFRYREPHEMKDSGVEWLGMIPKEWEVSKYKYNCSIYNGNSLNDELKKEFESENEEEIPYISSKDIDGNTLKIIYNNGLRIPQERKEYKIAPKNSSLICIEGGSAGKKIAFTEEKVCFVNKLACIHTKKNNSFIHYTLKGNIFKSQFNLSLSGLIGGVSIAQIKNFNYIEPTNQEQEKIATFLDQKTAEFDNIIAKKQAFIEKLAEAKKSLISEVVTGKKKVTVDNGKLIVENRKAEDMKDSGVEWLGMIPKEWGVKRIKYLLELRNERNKLPMDEVEILSLYTALGVKKQDEIEYKTGNKVQTVEDYKIVYPNDIVVNIILAWMGAIGMSEHKGVISPAYDIYKPLNGVNSHYYNYLFRTSMFAGECFRYGRGIMLMRWRTYSDEFKSIFSCQPSEGEQENIAKFLDEKIAKIDNTIEKIKVQIEKLKEAKQSLISEAVTGKIEVM